MADLYERKRPGLLSVVIKFLINSVVLLIVSFLVPGFFVAGFATALVAAIVIAILDYFVEAIFKIDATPFGRGLSGFIVAAVIIYATQFIVAGVAVSFWGAILAALVIGLINLIIPGRVI